MKIVHRVARRISVMREHSECIGEAGNRCWCLMAGMSDLSQDINIEDFKR